MQFSCTKKVLDQMKKFKSVKDEKVQLGFYNWYVDLINLERRNYFLFTHATTLFSFFAYIGTKKEKQKLETLFAACLLDQLEKQFLFDPKLAAPIIMDGAPLTLHKTNSRSVLGSMNDFKFQIRIQLAHKGPLARSYDLINFLINQLPMGGLNHQKPTQAMQMELEKRGLRKEVDPRWN